MTISIHFGALCDSISKQLIAQGYNISENDSLRLQDIADAIIMLKIHGIIPDSVIRNAEQKLMKKIIECDSLAEKGEP
jgi:hypothetical protein